jgi:hypothetical protein
MIPTNLDRLYRFSRHDSGGSAIWHVSAGTLETKTRLYRAMYRCGSVHDEMEVTIHVKKDVDTLKPFLVYLENVVKGKDDHDPLFRLACLDLLTEDPWLLMLRDKKA